MSYISADASSPVAQSTVISLPLEPLKLIVNMISPDASTAVASAMVAVGGSSLSATITMAELGSPGR